MPSVVRIASVSPEIEDDPSSPLKRKRDDGGKDGEEAEAAALSKSQQKRQKQKEKRKQRNADLGGDDGLNLELGINTTLGQMDPQLIADHIARQTKRFNPDLTAIETEELRIPAKAITDTSTYPKPRSTTGLPDFLKTTKAHSPGSMDLTKAPNRKGTPHTLVLASSGLRAADLTRVLRVFQSHEAVVAKLFAKHIKLAEAIESAKKTRMGIGVGTATRISDLLDAGALSAEKLERVVVDFSHVDVKKRGLVDMRETLAALVKLLGREDLKPKFAAKEKGIDLVFF